MDFTFFQQRKNQKYLIFVLMSALLLISIVVWQVVISREKEKKVGEPRVLPPQIKIDLEILENPVLKEFHVFEKIKPFEGEIGRENPFVPY